MKTFTREQKQAYFKSLREEWKRAKETAKIDEIQGIIQNHGWNISPISFAIVSAQMDAQHLDGLPYLDAKTFQGWRENGFMVKKGEKSTLHSITWVSSDGKEIRNEKNETEKTDSFVFPKCYNLFHRLQVTEIS